MDIADQLRKAIRDSGESALALSKRAKVDQTLISRFLRGKEMSIGRAGKLARVLGLELKPKGKK